MTQGDASQVLLVANLALVFATFLLVGITGWYAWETRRIRKNFDAEREILSRPLLCFGVVSWQPQLLKLRLENVGPGPALHIRGEIKSASSIRQATVNWSYQLLGTGKYEEFPFPAPPGTSHEQGFQLESIRQNVDTIEAHFDYDSASGKTYRLDEVVSVHTLTDHWIASRMLTTQDHPDRLLPRIAKSLEAIARQR